MPRYRVRFRAVYRGGVVIDRPTPRDALVSALNGEGRPEGTPEFEEIQVSPDAWVDEIDENGETIREWGREDDLLRDGAG